MIEIKPVEYNENNYPINNPKSGRYLCHIKCGDDSYWEVLEYDMDDNCWYNKVYAVEFPFHYYNKTVNTWGSQDAFMEILKFFSLG